MKLPGKMGLASGYALLRKPLPESRIILTVRKKRGDLVAHVLVDSRIDQNSRLTIFDNLQRTTELGGKNIQAGDKVMVSFLSANYDALEFDQPMDFDIKRTPNPHLSFGYGPHFCLGAQLAVAQMRAIFGELTQRFESIEATAPPRYLRSNFQRGVKSLPIRWRLKNHTAQTGHDNV